MLLSFFFFFRAKALKNENTGKKKDGFEKKDHWKEKRIRGWVWEVPRWETNGRQKNRGLYLKNTIEIQDPYANSTVRRGRGSWKIGNEEKREERFYIEWSNPVFFLSLSLSLAFSRDSVSRDIERQLYSLNNWFNMCTYIIRKHNNAM